MTPPHGWSRLAYWYVTPWPTPQRPRRPRLAGGGEWHDRGWFGAVRAGFTLIRAGSADAQAPRLDAFLRSARAACAELLDAPVPAVADC
jgi:hypothetical protein